VLAGRLKLATLVLDLLKEPGVLDGQRRLGREGGEKPHDLGRELARRLACHRQHADDLVLAQQGHAEQGSVACLEEGPPDGTIVGALDGDVVNLDGLAQLDHLGRRQTLSFGNHRDTADRRKHRRVARVGIVAHPQLQRHDREAERS
jgi:hypothetical protein